MPESLLSISGIHGQIDKKCCAPKNMIIKLKRKVFSKLFLPFTNFAEMHHALRYFSATPEYMYAGETSCCLQPLTVLNPNNRALGTLAGKSSVFQFLYFC